MGDSRSFILVADDQGVAWLHTSGHRLPLVSGGDGPAPKATPKADGEPAGDGEPFEIPEDLSTLGDPELEALTARAVEVLDAMVDGINTAAAEGVRPKAEQVQQVQELSAAIKDLKAEGTRRTEQAAADLAAIQSAVAEVSEPEPEPEPDAGDDDPDGGGDGGETVDEPAGETAPETAPEGAEGEPVTASGRRGTVIVHAPPKLNPTLADIARRQPRADVADRRPDVVITAAADVPHFSNGERIPSLDDLGRAATERCKALGIGNGTPHFVPLAAIQRQFPFVLDADQMTPQQVRQAWEDYVRPFNAETDSGMEALVAAGGWCAPSEIRYDFFNIAEVAGQVDLPTFGVRRGGLRWPQSLSLFDFFALSGAPASGLPTNATMPWEWTETDDISAVTGSPTKACLRPPCPDFDEERLRLFGLCVLAGNLTEDAFPELIRDFIAKVVVAHARVINRRLLLLMAAASTATTPAAGNNTAVTAWLGGLSLNATDYRHKHGMRDEAVLEVVAPSWGREVLRSDVAKRNGDGNLEAADAEIMRWFDTRRLRVQWVQDWQTRLASGIAPVGGGIPTNWPATADVLMYAPGTFGRGNGMTLDLGVVRDSVLNEANDHTAAWSEEATMVAMFGHESRIITLNTTAGGETGQQVDLVGGP